MAELNVYINFPGNAAEAFEFYAGVFGVEIDLMLRFRDIEGLEGRDQMSDEQLDKVMHGSMTVAGTRIMTTDVVPGMNSGGEGPVMGTSMSLILSPDTRAEADRIYAALSEDGEATTPMADMFWGDYWGQLVDRFGVQWMIDVAGDAPASA